MKNKLRVVQKVVVLGFVAFLSETCFADTSGMESKILSSLTSKQLGMGSLVSYSLNGQNESDEVGSRCEFRANAGMVELSANFASFHSLWFTLVDKPNAYRFSKSGDTAKLEYTTTTSKEEMFCGTDVGKKTLGGVKYVMEMDSKENTVKLTKSFRCSVTAERALEKFIQVAKCKF